MSDQEKIGVIINDTFDNLKQKKIDKFSLLKYSIIGAVLVFPISYCVYKNYFNHKPPKQVNEQTYNTNTAKNNE